MKAVILGAGKVGYSIAEYLASEENHITIVDQSADLLRKIGESLDVQPIVGFASRPDVLDRAGAEEADIIIAVTASDEVNMVACEVANSLFKVKTKIARIRNQSYLHPYWSHLFSPNNLAVDITISPEVEIARSIAQTIQVAGASDLISILGGNVKVVGVRCPEKAPILNTPLKLLSGSFHDLNIVIASITRNNKSFMPRSKDQILPNDHVYFVCHSDQVSRVMAAFGFHVPETQNVLVVGGGNIGLSLVHEIEKRELDIRCRIIEKSKERAEYVAQHLKETEVLCGNALDFELLEEANIGKVETIVSVTEDDKVNILSGLMAKQHGVRRTLSLLNNVTYASLVTSMGVDSIISPQSITVSTILHHVREGRLRSAHTLHEGNTEVIEAEARESSNIIGLNIEDLEIDGEIKVAALVSGDNVSIDPPRSVIHVGDRLALIVAKKSVAKVQNLFSIRPTYL